ncbi:prepilin-type N-terminal cleavage/methylation domain-containing protein [Synergistaceae bacterium OttesenSCG-928-I11]|nr:prepilin-type N-terminal cleavage/methylation domain-containing protein [Synergistaceae bacterium OttesenSCG-928-I11]
MSLNKKRGFTMMEALISVLVLGLVVTASLKLVALSERGLSAVREKEALIDEATKMQIALTIDPFNSFGISDDLEWNVTEREESLWIDDKIDINALKIGGDELTAEIEKFREQKLRWRELEITYQKKSMIVFLPYSEEVAKAASEDAAAFEN